MKLRGFFLFLLTGWRMLTTSIGGLLAARRGTLTRADADARLRRLFARLIRSVEATIEVHGRDNIPVAGPFLVMSNHQSHCDIPALFAAIPGSLRMVAKREMFSLPLIGQAMRIAEFIPIDRKRREQALLDLSYAQRKLADGIIVWIAPEGTRSRDGALLPFKRGGFLLAAQAQVPILPVTIDGTREILPAGSVVVRRGVTVRVTIHPPILPQSHSDRAALTALVMDTIESALPNKRPTTATVAATRPS